ncbi:MAG: AI-2E family transporter [Verrucomicrobiota bacterium]|nr:AI-2E family transporter [Verrucomicrobiota bacterium]
MSPHSNPVILRWVFVVVTLILFFSSLRIAAWIIGPLVSAFIMYYILSPPVDFLEAKGLSRTWSVVIVYFALVIISVVSGPFIVHWLDPNELQKNVPQYIQNAGDTLKNTLTHMEAKFDFLKKADLIPKLMTFTTRLEKDLPTYVVKGVLGLLGYLPFVIIVPYIAFYFLLDGRGFKREMIRGVPNRFFEDALRLFYKVDVQIAQFLRGLFIESLIVGTLAGVGLKLLGIDQYILLGVLTGLFNVVPYVGPLVAALFAIVISVTDQTGFSFFTYFTGAPAQYTPFYVLVLYILVRLFDDVVIIPVVMGKSMHMHPLLVVLAIFCGGELGGILGLILALPSLGVIHVTYQILFEILSKRREVQGTLATKTFWT